MGFLLSLGVNALAAILAAPLVGRVLHKRQNVDGHAIASLILFALFVSLYLVTDVLMNLGATEVQCLQ